MKKLFLLLLVALSISFTSCDSDAVKNEGNLHHSSSKLKNIEVISKNFTTDYKMEMTYYSFKDSCYHKAILDNVSKDSFIVGKRY